MITRTSLSLATLAVFFAMACSALDPLAPGDGYERPVGGSSSASSSGAGGASGSGSGGASPSSGGTTSGGTTSGGTTSGGTTSSGGGSSGSGSSGGGSSSGGLTGDGGTSAPPPSQPSVPGGFQATIAPLLDQTGCTECHHHGRPIDLTTYPFMQGSASDTAQSLVSALTNDMPPAPRTPATAAVVSAVQAWVDAGTLP